MNMSLRQAAAKALADLQLQPGWEQLDEKLREADPWGTTETLVLTGISERLAHTVERPVEVLTSEVSEEGAWSPFVLRALLYILNDLKAPAAIWPRERDGKQLLELIVYAG